MENSKSRFTISNFGDEEGLGIINTDVNKLWEAVFPKLSNDLNIKGKVIITGTALSIGNFYQELYEQATNKTGCNKQIPLQGRNEIP